MNADYAHQRQLKENLPHTWDALFARFGRFTEIQTRAIEPLLAGNNCVLVSATASGKTEAALAPLIELYKRDKKAASNLSILYIVPTRALARDLARRLQQPTDKLAVRMRIKTGDEPAINSKLPPELLLTTPESFDSLMVNAPRIFKDLRAVVIDELHIFDRTVRGDQLRILLNRLRRLKKYALSRGDAASDVLQYCALSATISDPAVSAAGYFTNPQVIAVAGQRAMDAELIELDGAETLIRLFAGLKQRGCKKVLAFCTSRAECEEWAYRLKPDSPFGDRVYVHHASLDARVRRGVEDNFAHAEAALCFATSTLELGIDIGDVDLVVLIGAPANTSAFLQRIGRGNRRTLRTSVVCIARHAIERALFQVFIRMAQASGEFPSQPAIFRPSVVVQQLCSYIKQTRLGEIDPDSAYELFATPEGAPLISKTHYDQIVEHLLVKQYFTATPGPALKPGPLWQELFEQRAIYTNLMDVKRGTVEVIEEETGRRIGEIDRGLPPGKAMLFGGQARQATRMIKRKLMVRAADVDTTAQAPRLRAPWRPMSAALAQAVAAELGVPRATIPSALAMVIESEDEDEDADATESLSTTIFHCAGDAWGLILGDLLETQYRVRVEDNSELYLSVKGVIPTTTLEFTAGQVRARLQRRWRQLESWFDLGRFQSQLPSDVRRASVIESFDVGGFLQSFNGRGLTEIEPPAPTETTAEKCRAEK
ncbi:MAG: DEAD/DEAH box helicase [Blastocatellia bacterium]